MKLVYLAFVLGFTINTVACDICNINPEIVTGTNRSSLGLYYRFRSESGLFAAHNNSWFFKHANDHAYLADQDVEELYQNIEIRAKIYFSRRFFTNFSIPVAMRSRTVNSEKYVSTTGIGDPYLGFGYHILERLESNSAHRLVGTAYVKFPLGNISHMNKDGAVVDLDMQSGTGSFDAWFGLSYLFRSGKWGLATQAAYRINGKNQEQFAYGDVINGFLKGIYIIESGDFNIIPELGIYAEYQGISSQAEKVFVNSASTALSVNTGASMVYKNLRIELNIGKGFYYHSLDNSVPLKWTGTVGFSYLFNLKE